MVASDLQENLKKLNNGMAFLIKHSQKLFKVRETNFTLLASFPTQNKPSPEGDFL